MTDAIALLKESIQAFNDGDFFQMAATLADDVVYFEAATQRRTESKEDTIERDGRTYRLKDEASNKIFLSVFGDLELARRYYHCYLGGAGIVPLDEAWDMQGKRYAVPEVVENVLWASAIIVPSEMEKFCARMCPFQPSTSCIQDIISRDGAGIADMLEAEKEGLACREIKVPEATEVVAFSLDGTTTLLHRTISRYTGQAIF